jgi:tRNA(Leu) C34 or U34 (ribose-2'-O)-methylase TrmL
MKIIVLHTVSITTIIFNCTTNKKAKKSKKANEREKDYSYSSKRGGKEQFKDSRIGMQKRQLSGSDDAGVDGEVLKKSRHELVVVPSGSTALTKTGKSVGEFACSCYHC